MSQKMSEKSFSYYQTQDGARLRYAFWPCTTPLEDYQGDVIIFQGRASCIEKFIPIAEELTRQGFHVWSFDWRGQGMSTRLLKDRRRGYIDSYETYLEDIDALLTDVILEKVKGPLVILGQSMGSQIALRYLERFPGMIDMAILTAPMFDLNTGGYTPAVARAFAEVMCWLGLGKAYVIGHRGYDPSREPFEGNMLTHDRTSFVLHRNLQKANPDLIVGGVTYGWVKASFDSITYLNRPEILGRIQTPVLGITAGDESVVDNQNVPRYLSWLPKGEHVQYEGARHQLLSESPFYLQRFWKDFMTFFHQHKVTLSPQERAKRRLIKSSQFSGVKRVYPTLPNDFKGL